MYNKSFLSIPSGSSSIKDTWIRSPSMTFSGKVQPECLPGLALWEGPRGWNSGLAETHCQARCFSSATDKLCRSYTKEEASHNTERRCHSSRNGFDSLHSLKFVFFGCDFVSGPSLQRGLIPECHSFYDARSCTFDYRFLSCLVNKLLQLFNWFSPPSKRIAPTLNEKSSVSLPFLCFISVTTFKQYLRGHSKFFFSI